MCVPLDLSQSVQKTPKIQIADSMIVRGKVGTDEKRRKKQEKKKDARKKMSQTLNLNFAASPLGFLLLPAGAAGFRHFGASFELDSLCENALVTCHFDRKIVFVFVV